jgi:hypothetical protein
MTRKYAILNSSIEQGPRLEDAKKRIGIVTGVSWIQIPRAILTGARFKHIGGIPSISRAEIVIAELPRSSTAPMPCLRRPA